MFSTIRSRAHDESGFTLIELLVVMIILGILMAVAVPTFIGQKNKALATASKANVTHVAAALDSCAAGTTSGTFFEGNTPICTGQSIMSEEAQFSSLMTSSAECGGSACITVINPTPAMPDSYVVFGYTKGAVNARGWFAVVKTPSNSLRFCGSGTAPFGGTPYDDTSIGALQTQIAPPTDQVGKRMCPSGRW